jgi:hypothetical protein
MNAAPGGFTIENNAGTASRKVARAKDKEESSFF